MIASIRFIVLLWASVVGARTTCRAQREVSNGDAIQPGVEMVSARGWSESRRGAGAPRCLIKVTPNA